MKMLVSVLGSFRLYRLLLLSLWLLAGCQTRPLAPLPEAEAATEQIEFIYRDWHTSLLLSSTAFANTALAEMVAPYQYVRVGFGDGDYFTGKSVGVGAAARALVASRYSAIQIIRYHSHPYSVIPAETRVTLTITPRGMSSLVSYIEASFATEQGELVPLKAYLASTGIFFLASHPYGWRQNCNTWSAGALRAAGLPIDHGLNLTSKAVFSKAKAISQRQQAITAERR